MSPIRAWPRGADRRVLGRAGGALLLLMVLLLLLVVFILNMIYYINTIIIIDIQTITSNSITVLTIINTTGRRSSACSRTARGPAVCLDLPLSLSLSVSRSLSLYLSIYLSIYI